VAVLDCLVLQHRILALGVGMGEMNEVQKLKERHYQPYTEGHRRMYTTIAELLGNRPAKILEVGFGIGYGLDLLVRLNCVKKYLGVEKDKDCFDYVRSWRMGHRQSERIKLIHADWFTMNVDEIDWLGGGADFSLCIEVIEHMEKIQALAMLTRILPQTKHALFLSTPNSTTQEHGRLSTEEVRELVWNAGFRSVAHVEWQWTTLFVCNPQLR